MSVRMSVGIYANTPYYFENLKYNVYSMEELSYVLKENALLLDTDLLSDRLVEWVGTQCALPELAGELHQMVHEKGSLSLFVGRILEYTGFYSGQEIKQAVDILKRGAGMNVPQKRKMRIDTLVTQRKYAAAVQEYDCLLADFAKELARDQGTSLKASILHNKGRALAGLMEYARAADCFREAYELDLDRESLRCCLVAKRMELSDKDYVIYTASIPDSAAVAYALEKDTARLNESWEKETDYLRLLEREELRVTDENTYAADTDNRLQALKERCRSMAKRGTQIMTALLLAVGLFTGCSGGDTVPPVQESALQETVNYFRVGVAAEAAPYIYKLDEEWMGFELKLMEEVASRNNWELTVDMLPQGSVSEALTDGLVDCVWGGFSVNGRKECEVTAPYMDDSQVFLLRPESTVSSKAELAGTKIGVVIKSTSYRLLTDDNASELTPLIESFEDVIAYRDLDNLLASLTDGWIEAAAISLETAQHLVDNDEDGAYVILKGDENRIRDIQCGAGFLKGNVDLKNTVQSTLKDMMRDGTLAAIAGEWELGRKLLTKGY